MIFFLSTSPIFVEGFRGPAEVGLIPEEFFFVVGVSLLKFSVGLILEEFSFLVVASLMKFYDGSF
jgi:hypothetical protein